MYDTRWPRPGPAMAAVAALLGLVAGALLGLSSPGSAPQAQAHAPVETTVAHSTTTLPEAFYTVVLGSYDERPNAEVKLRLVKSQGVKDAGLLDQEHYDLRTTWAVSSGVFQTEEEAEAHMEELGQLDVGERFVRLVKRAD
jgi:SPOR domain